MSELLENLRMEQEHYNCLDGLDRYKRIKAIADHIQHLEAENAKRVEIKDTKTVEAWAVVNDDAEVIALSPDGYFKGGVLPINALLRLVKLTGIIEGVMPKADNKREYLVEDDRGHGGQLGV